jgi:CelD/BcsL family acetyltransferase involved in cellulose biosynthesis
MTAAALTTRAGLAVTEVAEVADLAPFRAEWSALCDVAPCTTPFQRPEWLLPWCRAFPPAEPWNLLVRDGGRLVGLLPLFRYRNGRERTLALAGAGLSDDLDLIAMPGREREVGSALLDHLAGDAGWDVCDWEQLPAGSPLLALRAPAGWADEVSPGDPCPVLRLPERLADLPSAVRTRQLANLRKYRRKAAELGTLSLETATGAGLDAAFATLLDLHRARWAELGGAGQLGSPEMPGFLAEVAAGFAARSALALHLLTLAGRPLAGFLGFRERGTLYAYLQGSDPGCEKLSPGVLLLGAVIEESIASGLRALDFLRGLEPYKLWWGARPRQTYRRKLRRGG